MADVGPGTAVYMDASAIADACVPLYANSLAMRDIVLIRRTFGDALDTRADELGTSRKQAAGAIGPVVISTATGGTTLFAGDIIRNDKTGIRYSVLVGGTYLNGQVVAVQAKDKGPVSNAEPGTVLKWSSPRPGCGPSATVAHGSDGKGLKGGANVEADELLQDRLVEIQSIATDTGNAAQYIAFAESAEHGVPVEKAWVYPGILGPGSLALTFTVIGNGSSRIPNTAQLATVEAYIKGKMPEDDGFVVTPLSAETRSLVTTLRWIPTTTGWIDASPFPQYDVGVGVFTVGTVTSALSFQVKAPTTPTVGTPAVGKTIALWDQTNLVFVKKRIATVSGSGTPGSPYAITVLADNTSSDTAYVPITGQLVSPWSDTLNDLNTVIKAAYDALGPGEQVVAPDDYGLRQHRCPQAFEGFPMEMTTSGLNGLLTNGNIASCFIVSGTDVPATVGAASTYSNLIVLSDIAVYPK